MSFRTRLTSFFILIVVVPMIAVGFLVFRLISDSEQGKADARANGLLTAAASVYRNESATASDDAQTIARALGSLTSAAPTPAAVRARVTSLAAQSGLARVTVSVGSTTLANIGDPTAVAPGLATVGTGARQLTVTVSEITAAQYARQLAAPGVAIVVGDGARNLASTLQPAVGAGTLPLQGTVSVGGATYSAVSDSLPGFSGHRITATVLSSLSTTSVAGSRVLAAAFIAGFLLLAFSFSVLASRGLQGQVSRFLQAARRLGSGDFSSPIRIDGRDEFAALGEEFNNMSSQLATRLDELSQERVRLREAIRRIGQTFASNLDRPALLELALKTAMDAVEAGSGRVSARAAPGEPLTEAVREGSLEGMESEVHEAERVALETGEMGEGAAGESHAVSAPLGPLERPGRTHGLITVVRRGRPFSDDDRDLLRSLAGEAALALENVDLHVQVSRQAVTDELTGLANHGRFQELLGAEAEQVRRYHHSVALIMLDIDDFKLVNDTYGHQQGDIVLKRVARVLADSSREVDYPARYGGEEMAMILPHTDLEGAYAIAERMRTAIEALRIPRKDDDGVLRITASLGVVASTDANKETLIADADSALYEAKHQGKNRTVKAPVRAANVAGAE
jgi:diguanylate cyclase (GGDEF)-like protein